MWEWCSPGPELIYVDIIFKNYYGIADNSDYVELIPNLLIVKLNDPVRDYGNWLFEGWYRDLNLTLPWDFYNDEVEDYMIEENGITFLILYPK